MKNVTCLNSIILASLAIFWGACSDRDEASSLSSELPVNPYFDPVEEKGDMQYLVNPQSRSVLTNFWVTPPAPQIDDPFCQSPIERSNAAACLKRMTYGGKQGWRLPRLFELNILLKDLAFGFYTKNGKTLVPRTFILASGGKGMTYEPVPRERKGSEGEVIAINGQHELHVEVVDKTGVFMDLESRVLAAMTAVIEKSNVYRIVPDKNDASLFLTWTFTEYDDNRRLANSYDRYSAIVGWRSLESNLRLSGPDGKTLVEETPRYSIDGGRDDRRSFAQNIIQKIKNGEGFNP